MKLFRKPATWLVITILYSGFTFWLSSLPGRTVNKYFLLFHIKLQHADIMAHGIEYALLACCLLGYLWAAKTLKRWWWSYSIPIVAAGLVGAANEYFQKTISDRTATVGDGFANLIGAAVPVLICVLIRIIKRKKKKVVWGTRRPR